MQSPDDEDASFRTKRGKGSTGFSINATETANPLNELQLLTDIAVSKNNKDDSKILEDRTDKITKKTPDLEELHTDGGYGSKDVDDKMEDNNINLITTAVKGRKSEIEITIEQKPDNDKKYIVKCSEQTIISCPTKKKNKALFDTEKCCRCHLKEKCNIYKNNGRYYFTHSDFLKNKRNKNILKIPKERRKIRPNVEATIKEFKGKTKAGKLKVRGMFKTSLFAFAVGISINFGRIYRLLMIKGTGCNNISTIFSIFVSNILFFIFLGQNLRTKKLIRVEFQNI